VCVCVCVGYVCILFDAAKPRDCFDIRRDSHARRTGVYTVYMGGVQKTVFCEMTAEGGGLTVCINRCLVISITGKNLTV